jgi:hypothetical protein
MPLIWASYKYEQTLDKREAIFGNWYGLVGNLMNNEGASLRADAFEKYEEHELDLDGVYEFVYKEKSLDKEVDEFIKKK